MNTILILVLGWFYLSGAYFAYWNLHPDEEGSLPLRPILSAGWPFLPILIWVGLVGHGGVDGDDDTDQNSGV